MVESSFLLHQRFTPCQSSKDKRPTILPLFFKWVTCLLRQRYLAWYTCFLAWPCSCQFCPWWKVCFCSARVLCHASCLKKMDLLFCHCSWCCSRPNTSGVTYMFFSVEFCEPAPHSFHFKGNSSWENFFPLKGNMYNFDLNGIFFYYNSRLLLQPISFFKTLLQMEAVSLAQNL